MLSYSDEHVEFSEQEKQSIIDRIDELKVLDPAVGSGAFPMGILHKLVHVMGKIDEKNELWEEKQYQKALKEFEDILKIKDKQVREKELKEINEIFDENMNYPDYGRKLYIIQNSIFGVDIQPIAIQICKLRFFLSLIIDQKIDKTKENFGIKPLPHLETKFVAANALIGIRETMERERTRSLLEDKVKKIKNDLSRIYKKHFTIKTRTEKFRLIKEIDKLKDKLKEELKRLNWPDKVLNKIVSFNILDQTAKADWFDPEWMFGVEDGFDVVIGNPPYVRQEKIRSIKNILKSQGYKTFVSTADLYVCFYEKGYSLLKKNGILTFISSNKWMRAKYGERLRKFLKDNVQIIYLIDFGGYPVFEQTVDTNIILLKKTKPHKDHLIKYVVVEKEKAKDNVVEYIYQNLDIMPQRALSKQVFTLASSDVLALKEKIEHIGKPLKDWDVKIYRGVLTRYNKAFIIDTNTRDEILSNCKTEEERKRTEQIIKPVLRGRDIFRWGYEWKGLFIIGTFPALHIKIDNYPSLKAYLSSFGERLLQDGKQGHRKKTNNKWFETQDTIAYYQEFEKEKIVWQRVTKIPKFAYIEKNFYCEATTHFLTSKKIFFYLLGIFNSEFFRFAFYKYYQGGGIEGEIKGEFISRFPIPTITSENQHLASQLEQLVKNILSLTSSSDYLQSQEKQQQVKELEKEIDAIVYKLYNLTQDEIRIIEEN
ncbi:MAG: Eco57I restriction-modification methylase domain-containing protein [Desulfonauticus sp.]|nr:Eco57I restriction-modification methylase domain-containing protein [Desulfonauticus sp.]